MFRWNNSLRYLQGKKPLFTPSTISTIASHGDLQPPAAHWQLTGRTIYRAEPLLREWRRTFYTSGCLFSENLSLSQSTKTPVTACPALRCAGCSSDFSGLDQHCILVNGVVVPVCSACTKVLRETAASSESNPIRTAVEMAPLLAADGSVADLPIEAVEGLLYSDFETLDRLKAANLDKVQWIRFGELPRRRCSNAALQAARRVVALCPNCEVVFLLVGILTVHMPEELSKFPLLTVLAVGGGRGNDKALQKLVKVRGLQSLRLPERSWHVTDAGLKGISKLDCLTELRLPDSSGITDIGLGELCKLPRLRSLKIYFQWGMSVAGFASVAALPSLTSLTVRSNFPEGLVKQFPLLANLSSLDIRSDYGRCFEIGDVSRLTKLTSLRVPQLDVSPSSPLSALNKLRSIELCPSGRTVKDRLSDLAKLPELESLALNCSYFEPADLAGLGALTSLRSLKLRVDDEYLPPEVMVAISN